MTDESKILLCEIDLSDEDRAKLGAHLEKIDNERGMLRWAILGFLSASYGEAGRLIRHHTYTMFDAVGLQRPTADLKSET